MNHTRVLAAALILAPAVAFATNPCDYPNNPTAVKQCKDLETQTGSLTTQHEFAVRVDASISKADELFKTTSEDLKKAESLKDQIDTAIAQTGLDDPNPGKYSRVNALLSVKKSFDFFQWTLISSLGRLQTLRAVLPYAHPASDQFWRVEDELSDVEARIKLGHGGIDLCGTQLKAALTATP